MGQVRSSFFFIDSGNTISLSLSLNKIFLSFFHRHIFHRARVFFFSSTVTIYGKKKMWLHFLFLCIFTARENKERNKMGDGTESTPVQLKRMKVFDSG